MCGRFYIPEDDAPEELRAIMADLNRRKAAEEIHSGEIRPMDYAPVLARSKAGNLKPFAMRWGYRMEEKRPLINARSESADAKPLFLNGVLQHRCVVPAMVYYEWQKGPQHLKYAFSSATGDVLWMAGIYRFEDGQPHFTVLTREAAAHIAFVHDRMPVLLSKERMPQWTNTQLNYREFLNDALTDVACHCVSNRQMTLFNT